MNREALTQLVRVLHAVHSRGLDANFNLNSWISDGTVLPDIFDVRAPLAADSLGIPHACGTTACACGYAGLDDWFRERGLFVDALGMLHFGPHLNWQAATRFFRLTQYEAEYLFSPSDSDLEDPVLDENHPDSLVATIQRVKQFLIDGKWYVKEEEDEDWFDD